jgi:hypothetical protein
MQILWAVTLLRRMQRYPMVRRTALVPLRKALIAGRLETVYRTTPFPEKSHSDS